MIPLTPQELARKWAGAALSERASYQQHFLDLCAMLGAPAPPVFEPLGPFLGPPMQDAVDGGLVHPQVAGDGLRASTLGVQRDHRKPALRTLGDLPIGRKAAHEPQEMGSSSRTLRTVLRSGRLPKRTLQRWRSRWG